MATGILGWFRRRAPVAAVGTYTTWTWPPRRGGYTSMSWWLEPRTDPSPVGYFWAHQVALVGGAAAYAGLQTMGSEPRGKIAIFSVWGALDAEGPEYAAPFAGEGEGMTVRIRHSWEPGRSEQLRIAADGAGWWRADVGDRLIGRIRVDPTWAGLAGKSIMWTERYAGPLRRCADIGHAVAWFSDPSADDHTAPTSHHNHLAALRGCPGSSVTDAPGGVVHEMGG